MATKTDTEADVERRNGGETVIVNGEELTRLEYHLWQSQQEYCCTSTPGSGNNQIHIVDGPDSLCGRLAGGVIRPLSSLPIRYAGRNWCYYCKVEYSLRNPRYDPPERDTGDDGEESEQAGVWPAD